MAKIGKKDKEKIEEMFGDNLQGEVRIYFFYGDDCDYCADTEELVEEVSALDDKISLSKMTLDNEKAEQYNIERTPAIIFVDEKEEDLGVRFYGIPSGYEFNTFIEDIIEVSREEPELDEDLKNKIKEVDKEVKLQVFVTPTCPYCPRAVRIAHQMALLNPLIQGEMIEAVEFQELSQKFDVSGVPKTVINEGKAEQVGAVPVKTILDKIAEL